MKIPTQLPKRFVDKNSPVPIYHQIAMDIKTLCINEELTTGDKIPSEKQLSEMYDVSRVTLRQALSELEKDGTIIKAKGFGSIIAADPRPVFRTLYLPGTESAEIESNNFMPKLITMEQCGPIPSINRQLQISEFHSLIYIKRLFYYGSRTIGLNRSWINPELIPGILGEGLINQRLSKTLAERYGFVPASITNTIAVNQCSQMDMKLLNITNNIPTIQVTSLSLLEDSTPLEFSKTLWLGDQVKFKMTVTK